MIFHFFNFFHVQVAEGTSVERFFVSTGCVPTKRPVFATPLCLVSPQRAGGATFNAGRPRCLTLPGFAGDYFHWFSQWFIHIVMMENYHKWWTIHHKWWKIHHNWKVHNILDDLFGKFTKNDGKQPLLHLFYGTCSCFKSNGSRLVTIIANVNGAPWKANRWPDRTRWSTSPFWRWWGGKGMTFIGFIWFPRSGCKNVDW